MVTNWGEPTVFLVRVWLQPTGFRATARRIDSERFEVFAHAADLARYLESAAMPTAAASVRPAATDDPSDTKRCP